MSGLISLSCIVHFLKKWTLPVSMAMGALGYFLVSGLGIGPAGRNFILTIISYVQPMLLFCMLFLTFCKVKASDMRFCHWQLWMLLFQSLLFVALACLDIAIGESGWNVVTESMMLCFICPTATAAAVVTGKLGGNAGSLTLYTVMINLCTSLLVPLMVPLVHPAATHGFVQSFALIIGKVFPVLICPLLLAMALRRIVPSMVARLTSCRDLAFYLWAVSLALAIAVTTRSIVHGGVPLAYEAAIAAASLLACIVQFAFGRWIGRRYGEPISAAQSCGQKNTVLAIWMGYTFMSPITAIAGGFYSIWHNVWNSWQLASPSSVTTRPFKRA